MNHKPVDIDHFWHCVRMDELRPTNLLFEKSIRLDDNDDAGSCGNANVLIFGLDPCRRLATCGRLNTAASNSVLHMDESTLVDLLDCIDDHFQMNTVLPKYTNSNISIRSLTESLCKISVAGENVKMSLEVLLKLKQNLAPIKRQIRLFASAGCEAQLYNMLNHFCCEEDDEDKTKMKKNKIIESPNLHNQDLLHEMCLLDGDRFDRSLALEIANNFLNWFAKCLRLFANNNMLVEGGSQFNNSNL